MKYKAFFYFAFFSLTIITAGCRKDIYEEPPDPYENERLQSNHTDIQFGNGANAYFLKTNTDNLDTTENKNLRIRGTLFHDNPIYGPARITKGDFLLFRGAVEKMPQEYAHPIHGNLPINKSPIKVYNNGKIEEFGGFSGYSEFNIPKIGFIQALNIPFMNGSPAGYLKGSNFPKWPLNADKYYFYFDYSKLGMIGDSLSEGKGVKFKIKDSEIFLDRMAIDPTDPHIYMHANTKIPKLPLKNAGLGFSVRGQIPFSLKDELKFGNIKEFDNGNISADGTIDLTLLTGIPISLEGLLVFAFPINNAEEIAKFFSAEDFQFFMGGKGAIVFPNDFIEQFGLKIVLAEAALSGDIRSYDDFEISFVGLMEQPQYTPSELIEHLSGQEVDFLQWLEIPASFRYTVWGTVGSAPDAWVLGVKQEADIKVGGYVIVSSEMLMEVNTQRLKLESEIDMALFGELGFEGEVNRNGKLYMKAYGQAGDDFNSGPVSLDIRFDAFFEIYVNSLSDFGFKTKGNFYGKACTDIPPWDGPSVEVCVSINIGYEVSVRSDGSFRVCAEVGIDGFGFDICLNVSKDMKQHGMEVKEIPYDNVPPENRYFSDEYKKAHPEAFK